jgi:hypothetical protein
MPITLVYNWVCSNSITPSLFRIANSPSFQEDELSLPTSQLHLEVTCAASDGNVTTVCVVHTRGRIHIWKFKRLSLFKFGPSTGPGIPPWVPGGYGIPYSEYSHSSAVTYIATGHARGDEDKVYDRAPRG